MNDPVISYGISELAWFYTLVCMCVCVYLCAYAQFLNALEAVQEMGLSLRNPQYLSLKLSICLSLSHDSPDP